MGSNVGSSSRMSLLRLSRVMSSSRSPWSPLGCWRTVSCTDSRQMVCPTLRTRLGIICVMPSVAGIMLGELSGFWERSRYNREISYSVLARFCPLFFPHPHIRRTQGVLWRQLGIIQKQLCFHIFTGLTLRKLKSVFTCEPLWQLLFYLHMNSSFLSAPLSDFLFSPNKQSFIFHV